MADEPGQADVRGAGADGDRSADGPVDARRRPDHDCAYGQCARWRELAAVHARQGLGVITAKIDTAIASVLAGPPVMRRVSTAAGIPVKTDPDETYGFNQDNSGDGR